MHIRHFVKPAVAMSVIGVLYALARTPEPSGSARAQLAGRFHFTRQELPSVPGFPLQHLRRVHPSLRRIESWISAVGAAAALADLDGDGLANDVCYVDPRIDQVIVAPVPGSGDRYQPVVLDPSPLPYRKASMAPTGCLPTDLNEDGRIDLLVHYWGRTPIAFLRTAAGYQPREVVPQGGTWYTTTATTADLDGDGHLDLIVGNYFADGSSILGDSPAPQHMQDSMSMALNGGRSRILRWTSARSGEDPDVTFTEDPDAIPDPVARGWTLAVGAADLDGDLLPEIYFANDFGPDRLLHNLSTSGHLHFALLEGRRTLTTPKSKVLGFDSFKGMGVDFGDLNGDGIPDILVSNIAAEYSLEESHFAFLSTGHTEDMRRGLAPYVDRSEQLGLSRSGWGWDIRMADFDNDGVLEVMQAVGFLRGDLNRWPELHELAMANDQLVHRPGNWPRFQAGDDLSGHQHNPFYVRDGNGRYSDVARELGMADSHVSRGIAIADVDGDGRLDFVLANQWEPSYFYHNQSPAEGRFIGLHLLLPVGQQPSETAVQSGHPLPMAGRPAIGASVRASLPDGRILTAQVDGGNGHSGKRSPDIHLGLGGVPASTAIPVQIRWRDNHGRRHDETLRLQPGWHTVLLASANP